MKNETTTEEERIKIYEEELKELKEELPVNYKNYREAERNYQKNKEFYLEYHKAMVASKHSMDHWDKRVRLGKREIEFLETELVKARNKQEKNKEKTND